jgi:superfamily II DNA helicase RecQ
MKLRVVTVRLDPDSGLFDDEELVALQETFDVVTVSEHAFVFGGVPTLALVLRYRERQEPGGARHGGRASGGQRRRPQELAPPEDRALFEALRKWRNERARRDGRPAYVLFTNAQLVAIAAARPTTHATLQAIEGVGEARVRDFAAEVLAVVESVPRGAEVIDDGEPTPGP